MSYFHEVITTFDPMDESAFGTLEVGELTPVIQGDFIFGANTQIWSSGSVAGTGASVDTNGGRLRIQSGTTSTGFAFVTSRKPVRYRAGQGTVARFTPLFTSGSANNIQLWGMGSVASNAPLDGYFFGYNGTSFGIAHYNNGSATWYAQSTDWNGDKCDGSAGTAFTYQPDRGTPAMIKYPYLGYGDIFFFLQNPNDGSWKLVHTIRYANTTAIPQLSNPTMYYMGFTKNSGNTANKIMYCGSIGVFISGQRSFIGNPKWAVDSYKTAVSAETCMVNLKNATTYNGVTNRGLIRLHSVSASSTANTTAFVRFRTNCVIGGTQSYTAVNGSTSGSPGGDTITNGNSISSYDVGGTTATGGTYVFNMGVGPSGATFVDLTPYDLYVAPGEIMTISASAQANSNFGISLNYSEDI